ncbi:GNAT family N-acetyltransferase [Micromonospora sp. NBC_01405]|uniref:GNAT family N-acetyltransferase n=1 Tax=Micromonospora sp. NBC_01405 TaxID=2903589 RepID=UPI003255CECD
MTGDFALTGPGPQAGRLDADCPDVYFTAGYGTADAAAQGGAWHSARLGRRIQLPYVLRAVADGMTDGVSPYGYCGLHVEPGCPPDDLARFWARAVACWRDQGLVSLFLRFSPLDPAPVAAVRALGTVRLAQHGETVAVAVDAGPRRVWEAMAGRARTAVRKAGNAGLTAELRPATALDLTAAAPFRRVYERTMRRIGSAERYLFPDGYYRLLSSGLDKDLLLASVRDPDGEVVAAALVLRHRDRAHYHLAGSEPAAARDGANNLLVWRILEWAAETGCARVHLGGGVRGDDGLLRFKTSFGGALVPWWTGAVVLDRDRYAALTAARAHRLGCPVTDLRDGGFFPAYRAGGR